MPMIGLELLWAGLLLALLLGAAFGYGAAPLLWLKLPGMSRGEGGLFGLGLGLGLIALLMLLLGALRLIYPLAAWLVLAGGLALAATRGRAVLRLPAMPVPEGGPTPRLTRIGLALIVGLGLVYALVANGLVPPSEYDVVAYHFAIPKIYIQAHQITYIPFIPYANWPLNSEMLFMIGLLLRSELMAQLISWAFAAILCAGLVSFGARWLPAGAGWVAAAALMSAQMTTRLAGTGLIEIPLAGYTFLAFYALWHWRVSQARGWLVLSALLAGCAAATKLNGAASAIVFASVILLLVAIGGQPARAARLFVAYGLVSFLVVLPWYLKTWIFTGSPLWPFLYPLLGGRDWDELGNTYLLGYIRVTNMPPTLRNWLSGLWMVTADADTGRFGSFLLGPYMLALLPLGLLPAIWRSALRPLLGALALASLAFYTIWFLLTHQTRFLIPMVPLALLIGAAGVAWLWQVGPRPLRAALQVALLAWLLSGSWLFSDERRQGWQRALPYLAGQVDRAGFLGSIYPDYPAFTYINQQLPPEAYLLLAPYEARGYYIDRRYLWANPIGQRYLRLEQVPDTAALRAELQRQGVSYVLMNTRYIFDTVPYWEHIDSLLNDLTASHGRLIYESGLSRLYVLDYADAGALGAEVAP